MSAAPYPPFEKSIYERIKDGEWGYPSRKTKKECEKLGISWEEEKRRYWSEYNATIKSFKEACLDDVGLLNHEKANKIFDYAWQEGHSSGYYEVYQVLCDLADMLL